MQFVRASNNMNCQTSVVMSGNNSKHHLQLKTCNNSRSWLLRESYPPGNDHVSHLWKRNIIFNSAYPFGDSSPKVISSPRCFLLFPQVISSPLEGDTPLKINGWNIIAWRFGPDHVHFQMGWICRFHLNLPGCMLLPCTSSPHFSSHFVRSPKLHPSGSAKWIWQFERLRKQRLNTSSFQWFLPRKGNIILQS